MPILISYLVLNLDERSSAAVCDVTSINCVAGKSYISVYIFCRLTWQTLSASVACTTRIAFTGTCW